MEEVDLTNLYRQYYHSKISYGEYSDLIGFLLNEKLVALDDDILRLTAKGRGFVAKGGYASVIEQEYDEYLASDLDRETKLEAGDFDPGITDKYRPDHEIAERRPKRFFVEIMAALTLLLAGIIIHSLNKNRDQPFTRQQIEHLRSTLDSAGSKASSAR